MRRWGGAQRAGWPGCCSVGDRWYIPRAAPAFVRSCGEFDSEGREPIGICKAEERGRNVLGYGLCRRAAPFAPEKLLEQEGFKVAVLRASVPTARGTGSPGNWTEKST